MYEITPKLKVLTPYDPVCTDNCIIMDANESYIQIPDGIRLELQGTAMQMNFNRYPDHKATKLCGAFAKVYGVESEDVVAGNGSDEIISVLFSAFMSKGETFATVEPDFSMYSFYGHLSECRHRRIEKGKDFNIEIDNIIKICNNEQIRLLILSNPCNPTSIGIKREEIKRLVSSVSSLVVLDEAYMDFWDQSLLETYNSFDNLIILRTCSKAIGMAALRLGFAIANRRLSSALRAAKSPYNVSEISQRWGSIILSHIEELNAAKEEIVSTCRVMYEGILQIDRRYPGKFTVGETRTNFLSIKIDKPKMLYEYFLSRRIRVRLTGGIIRVTCTAPEENIVFLDVFEKYLKERQDEA